MADHRHHFRISVSEVVRVLVAIAALTLVLALLWEIVRPVSL